jgi:predicted phosphodiesterase
MARYGVIADIHGNREALEAVLSELQRRGVERLACLGDVVGYNADPDECVQLLRQRGAIIIAGNHDLIGTRRLDFRRCSNNAEYALRNTRRRLASASAEFLATLPATHRLEEDVVLVHGGVRDVQQYMTTPTHIRQNAEFLRTDFPGARLCFFGHSHQQKVYQVRDDQVEEIKAEGRVVLPREASYFVNPGSVDASRKREQKAAECAIFESGDWSLEFLRVRYDCASTEAKAAVLGYRIPPLTNRIYSLRKGLARRLRFA